jgi:two-component system, chemotaxis family, protein-glutamate methylesterase/glutaminase
MVKRLRPDVVTMDISMPKMGGLEATSIIMENNPVPIVLVTGILDFRDLESTFKALESGAVAVLEKPRGMGTFEGKKEAEEIVQKVKLMSEVRVVRRRRLRTVSARAAPNRSGKHYPGISDVKIVAIGASAGGPPALKTIISELPEDFPVPIVIVQHISVGFVGGLAQWLNDSTPLRVLVATDGQQLLPGFVYLAPDNYHMTVVEGSSVGLGTDTPEYGVRPAVSCLFRSVARMFGPRSVGVLLTGMGRDGAAELKLMKDKGATTIAQNKETSLVHGMPGEAIRLGAASHVLPLEEVAWTLQRLAGMNASGSRLSTIGS